MVVARNVNRTLIEKAVMIVHLERIGDLARSDRVAEASIGAPAAVAADRDVSELLR
jgi:hypothetical protein